jgi:Putative zinc-binding metallo-peptidase
MKSFLRKTIFLFCITALIISCTKSYTKEEIDKMFEPITSRYGIKIVYKIDENFAPMLVTGKRAKLDKLEPINPLVLSRYPHILEKALQKYPDRVIRKYLNAIYFCKSIESEGIKSSGTYGYFLWTVYLVNNGWKSDDYSESTFHHEFSSILLKRLGFYLNPWLEQNPESFKYLYETNKNKADVQITGKGTKADYEDGFITDYGRTTFENDFNEYAAMIFTNPHEFKKIMNQYPRVRGKFLIWINFYHKIDPIFTEEYLLGRN